MSAIPIESGVAPRLPGSGLVAASGSTPSLCFIRIYLKLSLPYTGESARVSTCNSPVVLSSRLSPLDHSDYLSSVLSLS
jgi:hypothetical protein